MLIAFSRDSKNRSGGLVAKLHGIDMRTNNIIIDLESSQIGERRQQNTVVRENPSQIPDIQSK